MEQYVKACFLSGKKLTSVKVDKEAMELGAIRTIKV